MRLALFILASAFAVILGGRLISAQDSGRNFDLSPFDDVRWSDDGALEVRLDEAWYELLAVNGVAFAEILEHAEDRYGDDARCRVTEDLGRMMSDMGRPMQGVRVHLSVRHLATGQELALLNVPMTAEKHASIVAANRAAEIDRLPRMERDHPGRVDPRYAHLVKRINEGLYHGSRMLTAREAMQDLDELEYRLLDQFSYLELRDVDHEAAFDTVRAAMGDEIRLDDFAIQIAKLLALFGDGHARVENLEWYQPRGWTPFLLAEAGADGRVVAFLEDRSALLDAEHPFVNAINGARIDMWIEQAAELFGGSPQWVRRNAVRDTRCFTHLCRELDVDLNQVVVTLENHDRTSTKDLTLDVSEYRPEYGEWPRKDHMRLRGDIGYVRIAEMNEATAPIVRAVEAFADADAIMIDVRGNTGGSRDILRAIFPIFMPPDVSAMVVNAARYRLSETFGPDHLEARFMYPRDSERWNDIERAAIDLFAESFEPEWKVADAAFSPWHFMVMSRSEDDPTFVFTKPVVVLIDESCFSATDIFVGAFDLLPNVTLFGETTGGGSGRTMPIRLANSGLSIAVSSMASFRPDGRLYDGRGIMPDITVSPDASFHTGDTDPVLDAAIDFLQRGPQ